MKKTLSYLMPKTKNQLIIMLAIVLVTLIALTGVIPVCAGTVGAASVVNKIVDLVFTIFTYIGILLLVWSIGMLVLAFKNEDADSKSRAMMMLVVSAVLIGLKPLLQTTGIMDILKAS